MDTRYWGPSGWKLLHLIAAKHKNKDSNIKEFLESLPYILPCKFCRASLSKYYGELPFSSTVKLDYWMYQIHNKVNGKLRKQGQAITANPPFSKVKELYEEELQHGCTKTDFPGWEFLFSVAKCHPLSKEKSTPITGAPETLKTDLEKNEWNVLEPEKRYVYWVKFWKVLPLVFPFEEWRNSWLQHGLQAQRTSKEMVSLLWRLRCAFENDLELLNKTTYSNLCRDLSLHKSGCSKKLRAKTCRRTASNRRTTRKTRLR